MDPLKKMLLEVDKQLQKETQDKVVVVGYSISDCLKKASEYFNKDISYLDYEILERGKKGLFKKKPYKLLITINKDYNPYSELEEFALKLGVGDKLLSTELEQYIEPKDVDGTFKVRIYKEGVFLTVCPPKGKGKPVEIEECIHRLEQRGVTVYDIKKIEKVVKQAKCEPVKVADYDPIPEHDSTCRVEITPDEMKAYVKITPPRKGGRDLKVEDIVNALKAKGVVIGFKEENIKKALDEEIYMEDILAAEGIPPKHGRDAYIEYKVRIKKEFQLEEDEFGRVDFKNLHLIENVVPGQVLAVKIPAEKGIPGRTLFNKIIPARDGKDIELKQGKNTILSEDGTVLKAEISGHVVMIGNRISVEDVYRVLGDVGPKTGNIEELGSVNIAGSVLDNYQVKAGGNIEVFNSIQKAIVEAEGNIVVKGGILGKDEAKITSSNGSVIARFIQSAKVYAAIDVLVEEAIIHSYVEAGERVICQGRRAQIVGGEIRAKKEVRARVIGSAAHPKTDIIVGYDPLLLKRFEEIERTLKEKKENYDKLKRTQKTLETRKKEDPDSFLAEQRKKLEEVTEQVKELEKEIQELEKEKEEVQNEMEELAGEGRVIVEKQIFPGVIIRIKNAAYSVMDERFSVQYVYRNGKIIEEKYVKERKK
ncbi:MAG: polymerase [Leptospiraceae bacterium]|nr:MAG: polymerase [Leptospiraceae bacterium]